MGDQSQHSIHKVGIIGGGQLAAMTAPFAPKLDAQLVVQTPNIDDPAAQLVPHVVLGAIADAAKTQELSDRTEVITFENEFIDLEALGKLAQHGVCFRPSLASLTPLLDKYDQRCYLRDLGLPVPQFDLLKEDVGAIAEQFGFPLVLKARRHGYDGRGTFIIKDKIHLKEVWTSLGQPELLVEQFIPFERELAVMAARGVDGEIVVYPVVETQQVEQVCRRVIAPAQISPTTTEAIQIAAQTLLHALDTVGIWGIELFLTADQQILINEIAPRTHNSGHYTLDACDISQFELHLRAVLGETLPRPHLQVPGAVMVNLLGYEDSASDYQAVRDRLAQRPQTFVHWYNKGAARPGRKLGHVTVLLTPETRHQSAAIAAEIERIWDPQP